VLYAAASAIYRFLANLTLIITAMIVIQTQQENILEKIIVIVPILIPKEDPEISVIATTKVAVLVSKRFLA